MTEPIPQELREAARLRLKRKVASMMLMALAESGLTMDQVEDRIDMARGGFMRWINRMVSGKTKELNTVSDLCLAMGVEPEFRMSLLPSAEPEDDNEPEGAA